MTANELADELTKMFRGEEYDRLVHEIPDFLRQQQAEIEALKKEAALQRLSDFTQEIEAKYGITTKWDGRTTYHETTESIGKAQEK